MTTWNENYEFSKESLREKRDSKKISRVDMNKLVMDYLVTEGYREAAEKFKDESKLQPSMELSNLDNRIKIRNLIENPNIKEAIELINKLHPELLDNDRYLYFHLQQLQLIEHIRAGKIEEALKFAQLHLSEFGETDKTILAELERTMALLAFEDLYSSPFNDLLLPRHRQKVASKVNAAILKEQMRQTTSPRLEKLIKNILWCEDQLTRRKAKIPRLSVIAQAKFDDGESTGAAATTGTSSTQL